jgi:hypothetical protein
VVEVTWPEAGGRYIGIAIEPQDVARVIIETRSHGSVLETLAFRSCGADVVQGIATFHC